MNGRLRLFAHIFDHKDEIILRDYLALERTKLANERTLLAYSRTSLYMLLGGVAFFQLQGFRNIQWLGYVALILGMILILVGLYRYFQIKARLGRYYRRNYQLKQFHEEETQTGEDNNQYGPEQKKAGNKDGRLNYD
jgi:putative membrane protein